MRNLLLKKNPQKELIEKPMWKKNPQKEFIEKPMWKKNPQMGKIEMPRKIDKAIPKTKPSLLHTL